MLWDVDDCSTFCRRVAMSAPFLATHNLLRDASYPADIVECNSDMLQNLLLQKAQGY